MCFIFHTVFFRHLYCFQMAFYLHLKPNDLEAAPSSRSLCSRRITKEYDLQLLVIFMVCSLRSNWRYFIGLSLKSFAAELILKCFSDYLRFAERPHEALLSSSNQCLCLSWSIWERGEVIVQQSQNVKTLGIGQMFRHDYWFFDLSEYQLFSRTHQKWLVYRSVWTAVLPICC